MRKHYYKQRGRPGTTTVPDILPQERQKELMERWDDAARQEMVCGWVPFVVQRATWWASKIPGGWEHMDDMIQEGTMGLIIAAERFEPQRGLSFGTYAGWWVKSQMDRYIITRRQVVRAAHNAWRQSAEGSIPEDRRLALEATRHTQSLDQYESAFNSDRDRVGGGLPLEPSLVCYEDLSLDDRDQIAYLQQGLSERNIEIVRLRTSGMVLDEIGEIYGITRERVRMICEEAYRHMRERERKCQPHTDTVESPQTGRSTAALASRTRTSPSRITSRSTSARPTTGAGSSRRAVAFRPTRNRSTAAPLVRYLRRRSRMATSSSSTS